MKYKTLAEIETRKAAILKEMEQEGADLDALKKEMDELRENAQQLRDAAAKAEEIRKQIAEGAQGIAIGKTRKAETAAKTVDEIRASKEYVDAYARYIQSEDDRELRALLGMNAPANGQVPVPALVDPIIKTAWENDTILSRVNKTSFKGNLQSAFERDADPAYEHLEGTTAITEEDLTLGVVELKPKNIKKFIRVSDEVIATGGEALVSYVYRELTYRVLKLLKEKVIADIAGASTSHSASAVGIPKIEGAPDLTVVVEAEAELSDEAENVVVIINRKSSATFNQARVAGNFAVDPYDGLPVLYTSALPAYATASANAVWMIVGDLYGEHVNYPEGEGVITKYDDVTEAEADMVKIHGRQYAAHGVDKPGMFCNVKKAAAVTT
ncbi:MAG: phage major capsid protein [Clostridia bacterium]|nr:phage major capsid protein [Clostridia bacterium]